MFRWMKVDSNGRAQTSSSFGSRLELVGGNETEPDNERQLLQNQGPQPDREALPSQKDEGAVQDSEYLPISLTGQIEIDDGSKKFIGSEKEVSPDAYGAALVAVCRTMTVISIKRKKGAPIINNIIRLGFAFLVFAMNCILQISILVYIERFVVETSVHDVQELYGRFQTEALDSHGALNRTAWSHYDLKDQVCTITMTNPAFYYSILMLWALTNLHEMREIERFCRAVIYLKKCKDASDMLLFVDRNFTGKCYVTGITTGVRITLLLAVLGPRLFIEVKLLFLGWRWLSASSNFADMVLNSLALGFVVNIDELIFHSVLPVTQQKQIADTSFFQEEKPKDLEKVEQQERKGYYRTLVFVSVLLSVMFLYGEVLQTVLPPGLSVLSDACAQNLADKREVLCQHTAFQLRSNRTLCYRYT